MAPKIDQKSIKIAKLKARRPRGGQESDQERPRRRKKSKKEAGSQRSVGKRESPAACWAVVGRGRG